MIVDFGNGVQASTDIADAKPQIVAFSGADVPEWETPTVESAVRDGGIVGTQRAKMRRMSFRIRHDKDWTRYEVMRMFSSNVERTVSSTLGSMSYQVEALTFPSHLLRAEREFMVVIVSSDAYPKAAWESSTLATGSGTIDSKADVDCQPTFTCTIGGDTSGVVITTPGCVTTITGAFVTNDVLVVDSAAHTVTVNAVNRISWFDRTGKFPRLTSGSNTVSVTNSAGGGVPTVVTWYPRVMGLI